MSHDFDDEAPVELATDDPPKSGLWVDPCEVLENPTEEELELGRIEGEKPEEELSEDE